MNTWWTSRTYPTVKPREKIQLHGVEQLSTAELLTVILGSGSQHVPVSQLARRIADKLAQQRTLHLPDLLHLKGIGLAKACQILAAIELVERLRPGGYPLVDSLDKVLLHLGELRYAQREHLICLYLNARMQLVFKETLAMGSVNQTIITPRDVFSVIKHHPVSFIILAHNHPSGTAKPSEEDLKFTELMSNAGFLLGIEVLDHIIVAGEQHFSCREQKVLPEIWPSRPTL